MSDALRIFLKQNRGRAARLAAELDISQGYLSQIQSGQKTPSVGLMRRIADLTGLPLARLVGAAGFADGTAPPELRPSLLAIARLEHVARNARAAPLATPTPARGGDGGGGHEAALQVARALAHDRTCPTCAGTGWVQGPEVMNF